MIRFLAWVMPLFALGLQSPMVAAPPPAPPNPHVMAGNVDLTALRDTICHIESRPFRRPDAAWRQNQNGTADRGYCQINDLTLKHLGYYSYWRGEKRIEATRDPTEPMTREGSKRIALELLQLAAERIEARGWRMNAYNLTYLYACGLNSTPSPLGKCHATTMNVVTTP